MVTCIFAKTSHYLFKQIGHFVDCSVSMTAPSYWVSTPTMKYDWSKIQLLISVHETSSIFWLVVIVSRCAAASHSEINCLLLDSGYDMLYCLFRTVFGNVSIHCILSIVNGYYSGLSFKCVGISLLIWPFFNFSSSTVMATVWRESCAS